MFGFSPERPVLMVVGGSSGARAINAAVVEALPKLTQNFQVLHLRGKGNLGADLEGTPGYVQCEYLNEEMADAYACADLLISRAGSNALCEILALKKPALLIPYPKGASRGDQILNAESFRKRGFSHVMMQEDLTPQALADAAIQLYHDRGANVVHVPSVGEQTGNQRHVRRDVSGRAAPGQYDTLHQPSSFPMIASCIIARKNGKVFSLV